MKREQTVASIYGNKWEKAKEIYKKSAHYNRDYIQYNETEIPLSEPDLYLDSLGNLFIDGSKLVLKTNEGKLIEPISLYYNEDYNIIIVHSIISGQGIEWKAAEFVLDLAKKVDAYEIVSIEGVGTTVENQNRTFYFCNNEERVSYLQSKDLQELKEGIVMGVTASLLMKSELQVTCLFGEAESNMPDNNAAASIIEALDRVFEFKIDPAPLRESAKDLEKKFKQIWNQMNSANEEKDKKMMSYVG